MKPLRLVNHVLKTPRRLRRVALAGAAVALMASGIAVASAPSGPLTTGSELFSGKGDQVRIGIYGVYGRFHAHITGASTPAGDLRDGDKVAASADSATFTFDSVNQDGIHQVGIYRCHLNHGGTKICLSGKSYSHLKPGHYKFKVWDLRTPGQKATLSWTIKRAKHHHGHGHHGHKGHDGHGHGHGHASHGAEGNHGHGGHGHKGHGHASKSKGHKGHGHAAKSHNHKQHGHKGHGHGHHGHGHHGH